MTINAQVRITSDLFDQLKELVFSRYPRKEWATFLTFGYHCTQDTIILTAAGMIPPEPGDLSTDVSIVQFNAQYSVRAALAIEQTPLCIGVVHSHPKGYRPLPSALDDDMDSYFNQYFVDFAKPKGYCSLIFALKADGALVFSGRGNIEGQAFRVTDMVVVGKHSIAHYGNTPGIPSSSVTERLEQVYGSDARQRLQLSSVTIVGCGGTGSAVAHILARAGVQRFVLVDHDQFEDSNLERLHGSSYADVKKRKKRYKVEIVRDLIHSINPSATVTSIVGNILQPLPRDYAVTTDIAFGCTDTAHGRVGLSELAYRYLLPALDIGVQLDGREGKVRAEMGQFTMYYPGAPCAYCLGHVDHRQLTAELMSPEERDARRKEAKEAAERGDNADHYWVDLPVLHTVGHLTTLAAALVTTYGIGWLTGKFGAPAAFFQFDLLEDNFGYLPVNMDQRSECTCRIRIGYADQGAAYTLISAPGHWPAARRV